MSQNGTPQQVKMVRLDPLNPPEGIVTIMILQVKDPKTGVPYIDVQSHLLKDLRNEEYVVDLMEAATKVVSAWFKKTKEERGLNKEIEKIG